MAKCFFKLDIFCSCFTFGHRMIDPDCERKRFVETLEDPRAVTALVGVVVAAIFPMVWYGMVWYGMVWYGMVVVAAIFTQNPRP